MSCIFRKMVSVSLVFVLLLHMMVVPVMAETAETPALTEDSGELLAYDPFLYNNNASLQLADGGRGFGGSWTIQDSDTQLPGYQTETSEPPVYSNLTTAGGYATGGSSFKTAYRSMNVSNTGPFAEYVTSGGKIGKPGTTLWFSGMLRKNHYNRDHLSFGYEWNSMRLQAGYFGAEPTVTGTTYWSFQLDGVTYPSTVPIVTNEASFLALKVEYGTPNKVSLYVNPALNGGEPSVPSAQAETAADLSFSNVTFYAGNSPGKGLFDELRIGTSFGAVAPTAKDTSPPSAPVGVAAGTLLSTYLQLNWQASSDDDAVAKYQIYNDGAYLADTVTTGYDAAGLQPDTRYQFQVRAVDYAGNVSESSEVLDVTTPPETVDPVPGKLLAWEPFGAATGKLNGSGGGRGWKADWEVQDGNNSVPGYEVRDASPLTYPGLYQEGGYSAGGKSYLTAYRGLDLSPSGPFAELLENGKAGKHGKTLWFSALLRKDQNNNDELSYGNEYWQQGVQAGYFGSASNADGKRYWSLKIDNNVYRSNIPVIVGKPTLVLMRIDYNPTTLISMYVDPADFVSPPAQPDAIATSSADLTFLNMVYYGGSGPNQSSFDEIRIATKYSAALPTVLDTEAPQSPEGLTLQRATDTTLTLGWNAATDNVGVTDYQILVNGALKGTTSQTEFTVRGLTFKTNYSIILRALDGEGNASGESTPLQAATVEPADFTRYNFENGDMHGFKVFDGTAATVSLDSAFAYKGEGSVKVQFAGSASTGVVGVGIDRPDPRIHKNQTITFRVYIPADSKISALQPMIFGAGWTFNGGWADGANLKKGEWNTYSVDFTQGDSPSERLGFNIFANDPVTLWIDSITYSGYGEPDTTPPTVPAGLAVNAHTDTMVSLLWQAAKDYETTVTYDVFANDNMVGSTKGTAYSVLNLEPSKTYTFTVKAKDEAGNVSASSLPVSVVTDPPYTRLQGTPFGTEGIDANRDVTKAFDGDTSTSYAAMTGSGGYVGMDMGENQYKQITKIRFFVDGAKAADMKGGKFQGSALSADGGYDTLYTMRIQPAEGWNEVVIRNVKGYRYIRYMPAPGKDANVSELEMFGKDGDALPPSAPQGVTASNVKETRVTLSWNPSTDNYKVKGYRVYDGIRLAGFTEGTTWTIHNLDPNTPYSFTVRAEDEVGLISESSEIVPVTTAHASVTVQASFLNANDQVNIRGTVTSGNRKPVAVKVTDEYGRIVYVGQTVSGYTGQYVVSFTLPNATEGDYTVIVNSQGTMEGAVTTFVVDLTAPTGEVQLQQGAAFTGTTVVKAVLTGSDNGSGLAMMSVSWDGKQWSEEEPFVQEKSLNLPAGDGAHKLFVRITDKAGNVSTVFSDEIVLDMTKPVLTATSDKSVYDADHTVLLTCTSSDATSGIATAACTSSSKPAYTYNFGANTAAYNAVDRAGNRADTQVSFQVKITFDGLCRLVKQKVTNKKLADGICAIITIIKMKSANMSAATKNELRTKWFPQLIQEIDKNRTTLTPATADLLMKSVKGLQQLIAP
ncbi:hypothetical protein SY83_20255 [Paenibacillus swuensis]|uniref:Fibronectin type-III domain-containing protein n=1 Tax=Paenibacillus swuensis TaxID=1178515 RepID=A0A172TN32_9BACL|nr:fibronectin type III domain-containing protein [Paenibacillus swuensis]ANE48237.1 hypothetical protein SY83_20255 [Paenibacillus swuensis]